MLRGGWGRTQGTVQPSPAALCTPQTQLWAAVCLQTNMHPLASAATSPPASLPDLPRTAPQEGPPAAAGRAGQGSFTALQDELSHGLRVSAGSGKLAKHGYGKAGCPGRGGNRNLEAQEALTFENAAFLRRTEFLGTVLSKHNIGDFVIAIE